MSKRLKIIRESVKEETVNETLPANAKASDYIDDFVHSKNKMFKGDSKAQRIKRALGAYYSHKKANEEVVTEAEHKDFKEWKSAVRGHVNKKFRPSHRPKIHFVHDDKINHTTAHIAENPSVSTKWTEIGRYNHPAGFGYVKD